MRRMMYLKNVATLELNEEKCIGCGMCVEVCPQNVIVINGANLAWIQNRDACMECGACSRNCPTEAVSVQAGVGCAAAVINAMLGRDPASCSCTLEPRDQTKSQGKASCC